MQEAEFDSASFSVFRHRHAVFFLKELICPADIAKPTFKNDIRNIVIAVFEHIGDHAKSQIVDEFGRCHSHVFFDTSRQMLAGLVGQFQHTGKSVGKISVFLHRFAKLGQP